MRGRRPHRLHLVRDAQPAALGFGQQLFEGVAGPRTADDPSGVDHMAVGHTHAGCRAFLHQNFGDLSVGEHFAAAGADDRNNGVGDFP